LALVFALARPLVRGHWLGVAPAREVVLVLDNSLSMARIAGNTTAFDTLQSKSEEIIDELSDQDALQVVLAAGRPQWLTPEAVRPTASAKSDLKRRLKKLEPTRAAADLFACIQLVAGADSPDGALARRIVVLTDMQARGWQADVEQAWQQFQQFCENAAAPITVEVLDCGAGDAKLQNLVVSSLKAERTLVATGESVTISAEVKNLGNEKSKNTSLVWHSGKEVIKREEIAPLEPGETRTVDVAQRLEKRGAMAFLAKLQGDDDLPLDDEASVVVEAVEELPILVVHSGTSDIAGERLSDLTFFTNALGYRGELPVGSWQSLFKPQTISADELSGISLGDYRVVVILNLRPLPEAALEQLTEFVHGGGGLWVALAGGIDRESFNAAWYDDGAGLCPLPIVELVDPSRDRQRKVHIHPPDGTHPALIHLADTERLDIDDVEIERYFAFDRDKAEYSALLETGSGEPLAVEHYLGQGRVIVQSIPLGYAWSNLARTKAFVVLIHDWLTYLSQPAATRHNLPAGSVVQWRQPSDMAVSAVELITPTGEEIELTPLDDEGGRLYRFRQTDQPGAYDLKLTEGRHTVAVVPFRVPRDGAESELVRLDDAQQATLTEKGGVKFVEKIEIVAPDMPQVPNEKPIWWPLLWALLVLLACELLVASRAARQRYSSAPALA
jgi:hypothetical protein